MVSRKSVQRDQWSGRHCGTCHLPIHTMLCHSVFFDHLGLLNMKPRLYICRVQSVHYLIELKHATFLSPPQSPQSYVPRISFLRIQKNIFSPFRHQLCVRKGPGLKNINPYLTKVRVGCMPCHQFPTGKSFPPFHAPIPPPQE